MAVSLVLYNQELEVRRLQNRLDLRMPIVEMFSNDPRLGRPGVLGSLGLDRRRGLRGGSAPGAHPSSRKVNTHSRAVSDNPSCHLAGADQPRISATVNQAIRSDSVRSVGGPM